MAEHGHPNSSVPIGRSGLPGAPTLRRHGVRLEPAEIAARAAAGEPDCAATVERYEERMARALAGVVNVLDPDVIVLGGGLSNLAGLYERVPALWQRWAFSDRIDTPLLPPKHGDSSGVRGAAWLWPAPDA